GRERPPSLSDREKLPFTNAVLYEVQRFASIVPLALPHATTRDALFQGYFLPEGTIVFAVLDSVLKDPSQWETPEEFNPSHFLDRDGKFRKRDAFLPFSAGRRVCLGEQLAKAELFLFLVALLQKFSFVAPRGPDSLNLAPQNGITVAPLPFEVSTVPL
uniref:Uncharacterized protein n=1 Tax=Petromyzon marinus TaxID=7757 RepID=S4RTL2_PETMA